MMEAGPGNTLAKRPARWARMPRRRCLALLPLLCACSAYAIPPPPPAPAKLHDARMTATVQLVEARNGSVSKLTELCKVSGPIPVYADDGAATGANAVEIPGCHMRWKGKRLPVSVHGAMAIGKGPLTFATARVNAVPPDARPLCANMCGPQPLAASSAAIRVGGTPKSLQFSLTPNPVSLLNSKPTVWLEADIVVED